MSTTPPEQQQNDMARHRSDDDSERVRIIREIPLWGVVTLIAGVISFGGGQAISQFYGQREQEASLARMSRLLETMAKQLEMIQAEIKNKDIKDVQHDMSITDLYRRVDVIDRNIDILVRRERVK